MRADRELPFWTRLDRAVSSIMPTWMIRLGVTIVFAFVAWCVFAIVASFVMMDADYAWTVWSRLWAAVWFVIFWLILSGD